MQGCKGCKDIRSFVLNSQANSGAPRLRLLLVVHACFRGCSLILAYKLENVLSHLCDSLSRSTRCFGTLRNIYWLLTIIRVVREQMDTRSPRPVSFDSDRARFNISLPFFSTLNLEETVRYRGSKQPGVSRARSAVFG